MSSLFFVNVSDSNFLVKTVREDVIIRNDRNCSRIAGWEQQMIETRNQFID